MLEHLPHMCQLLGSTPSPRKIKANRKGPVLFSAWNHTITKWVESVSGSVPPGSRAGHSERWEGRRGAGLLDRNSETTLVPPSRTLLFGNNLVHKQKPLAKFRFCLWTLHWVSGMTVAIFVQMWSSFPELWGELDSWIEAPLSYFKGTRWPSC